MGYRRSYYWVQGFSATCPWFQRSHGARWHAGGRLYGLYGRHNTKHGACLVHGERFLIFALNFPHLLLPLEAAIIPFLTLSFSGWAGEFSMDLYPVAWAACHSGLRHLGISRDQRTVSRLLDRRAIGHGTHGSKQGAHSGKGGWECVFVGLQRHAWLPTHTHTHREREREAGHIPPEPPVEFRRTNSMFWKIQRERVSGRTVQSRTENAVHQQSRQMAQGSDRRKSNLPDGKAGRKRKHSHQNKTSEEKTGHHRMDGSTSGAEVKDEALEYGKDMLSWFFFPLHFSFL